MGAWSRRTPLQLVQIYYWELYVSTSVITNVESPFFMKTAQTYIYKVLHPTYLQQEMKMDLFEDVNLTSLSREIESFSDYYYVEPNFTDPNFFDELDLCAMSKPVRKPALILTIIMATFGLLLNCCVIGVVVILKEHKISRIHWSFLHIMVANVVFLLFLSIRMANELQGEWMTGLSMCKINEASLFTTHGAGVVFLVMANLYGILSQLKPISCKLPHLPTCPRKEIIKSLMIPALVWLFCCLINMPLYRFSTLNDCKHCALEFPVTMEELCPILDFNITICEDLMKFLFEEEKLANFSEANSTVFQDITDHSGDMFNNDYKLLVGQNLSTMVGLASCKFEEPRSFYIWLYATFTLFFITPIPFLAIYVGFWLYKNKITEKIKKNSKQKNLLGTVIATMNILFIICWTPWNSVQIRKVRGITHKDGKYCEDLSSYTRLIAVCYNALLPLVYIILTPDFRLRSLSTIATVCQFHSSLWYRDKSNSTQNSEEKIEISDCEMVNSEAPASNNDKQSKIESLPDTDV